MQVGRRDYGSSMLKLASYMKGDTCATKEGRGRRNAPMSLTSSLHERHKKRARKKNKPSTSIASFGVQAGIDCQREGCVCICTKVYADLPPAPAIISRVSTCRVEVV